jgi:hypothetical protein
VLSGEEEEAEIFLECNVKLFQHKSMFRRILKKNCFVCCRIFYRVGLCFAVWLGVGNICNYSGIFSI